jgi:signal peptidase II
MPFVGGEHFIFFRPIFNFADAAITVGMAILIFFYSAQISEVPWRLKSQQEADESAQQ